MQLFILKIAGQKSVLIVSVVFGLFKKALEVGDFRKIIAIIGQL